MKNLKLDMSIPVLVLQLNQSLLQFPLVYICQDSEFLEKFFPVPLFDSN